MRVVPMCGTVRLCFLKQQQVDFVLKEEVNERFEVSIPVQNPNTARMEE